MQAMILAAGMGKRLKSLTAGNTKCMVKVNGITLVERALRQLEALPLERIIIVVGYMGQQLMEYVDSLNISVPVEYVENPIYDKTNNIYSLYLAKDRLAEDDTLLLESDLIFEDGILKSLIEDERPTLALVDKYESWMDGTVVELDRGDHISAFIPGKKADFSNTSGYYKTVNVYKFSKEFSANQYVPFLEAYSTALGNNEYYEQVLRVIALLDDSELQVKRLDGQVWYEIDDLQDLDIAESLFKADGVQGWESIESRKGGYWRYPHMKNLGSLANPCYPPQRLLEEMKASFDRLLLQEPSDERVVSLLVAKTFALECEHVAAAATVSQLVAGCAKRAGGSILCLDQPHDGVLDLVESDDIHVAPLASNAQAVEVLEAASEGANPSMVLLTNPRAFWGRAWSVQELESVCDWCASHDALLIIDETLVDMCADGISFATEDALAVHPGVVVVKDLSCAHGVPGAQLAYLASADLGLVADVRNGLSSHPVNSVGEFYLQIAEKYKGDYAASLEKARVATSQLRAHVERLKEVEVVNAEANYLLLKVEGDAKEFAAKLLSGHGLLAMEIARDDKTYIGVAACKDGMM